MNSHHFLLDFVTWFVLCYFILLNGGYLVLNMLSLRTLHRKGQEEMLDDLPRAYYWTTLLTIGPALGRGPRSRSVRGIPLGVHRRGP